MGFFRRSGPTLEHCIETHDYEGVVRFYLKGAGNDVDKVIGALLLFGENDPQPLADVLGGLDAHDMRSVAEVIVQSGGPDHPAVLALARSAGPELGRALGRAVIRCVEGAFDALVISPGNTDPNARLGAICLLEFIGKAGIPALKEILYRADGKEQRKVAACLQRLGWSPENPEEKPMFLYLCDDWKELIRLKERALPLMFSLIKSDDPAIRRRVLQALEEIGDSRAVPAILPYVDDSDPSVRIAAVSALTCYDTPEAQQRLVSALAHADSQIRIDAAHALKRKGWTPPTQDEQIRYTIASGNSGAVLQFGDTIIPDLIQIVRTGDNEWSGAVSALAGLGPVAEQELQNLLPTLPKSRQKEICSVFKNCADKNRLRRENLQTLSDGEGEEQRAAAIFMRRMGWIPESPEEKAMFFYLCDDWKELIQLKEHAFPLLFSLVESDDPAIRRHAIQALEQIGDSQVVPAILSHVDDSVPSVRIAAISALMSYDVPETQQRLVSALDHKDSQIRIDAAHALKRKGWTPRTQDEQIRYLIASGNWDGVMRLGDLVIPDLIRIVRIGDNEWQGAIYALAGMGSAAEQELQNLLSSLPKSQQKDIISVFKKSVAKHRLRREKYQKLQELERKNQEEEKKISRENESRDPSDSEIMENQKRVIEGFKWMRMQKVATEQIYSIISEGVDTHNISFEMPVAVLSSKDEAVRAAAIDVLSVKGERGYPHILKAAYDKSPIVRTAVADAIGSIGQPSMMKVLILLSKDPSADVRLSVAGSLEKMEDERAFPYILRLFSDEEQIVRDAAAHAAASYGQFGLPVLIRSLHMQDPNIRIAAATALGEICDFRSLQYILPHLDEPDHRVREAIQAAIVRYDYRAIEPLQAFIVEAEGEAKDAALLALYEINPDFAGEGCEDSRIFKDACATGNDCVSSGSQNQSNGAVKRSSSSGKDMSESADVRSPGRAFISGGVPDEVSLRYTRLDSQTCEELILRIEGGEESLSSALLNGLYDNKSSLKADIMSAMWGRDRDFAMHAGTLLSKIGWSPDDTVEETLFLLATGKTNDLKNGGASTARVLSAMVHTMPPSVQNVIADVLSGIGGSNDLAVPSQTELGDSGAAPKSSADTYVGPDSSIHETARQDGAGKQRLQNIIRKIERGR